MDSSLQNMSTLGCFLDLENKKLCKILENKAAFGILGGRQFPHICCYKKHNSVDGI